MQDKKQIDLMRYVVAKDLIASVIESLPDLDLSDDEKDAIDREMLSDSNNKKMEVLNYLIGYHPPSVSP